MIDRNAVVLPPGVTPVPLKDVDRTVSEAVGLLMRRHHHSTDSTCDWCLQVARHVLADATNLVKSRAHRDDPVATFIRRHRDEYDRADPAGHNALDDLLDAYRLHADTGVPLTEPTPSPQPDDGDERLQRPCQTVPGFGAEDGDTATRMYEQEYLTYIGANIEHPDLSDEGLNQGVQAHRHALLKTAEYVYRLAEGRRRNDAATALVNYRDLHHYPSRIVPGMCVCGEDIEDDGLGLEGCVHWRSLTDAVRDVRVGDAEMPASVVQRAVDGYSRSGEIVDTDVFAEVLHDLGGKLFDEFRLFRAAFHADQVGRLRYPLTVLDKALGVLSALTGALNHTRTLTTPEIVDRERSEAATEAGDLLRLHLVSHHWMPEVLGMTDEGAYRLHNYLHAGRLGTPPWVPHDVDAVTFDVRTGLTFVGKLKAEDGALTYQRLFREHRARHERAGGPAAGDG